jgi:hypothetical protein
MRKFRLISYKWQTLGNSPRFQPAHTAGCINTFKKSVRRHGFRLMALEADKLGYVILNLYLKSCYASTAIGLYPHIASLLRISMDTVGLWDYIKKEFEDQGKGHLYPRSSVKMCVSSSFFGGGRPAFKNAIVELWRNN